MPSRNFFVHLPHLLISTLVSLIYSVLTAIGVRNWCIVFKFTQNHSNFFLFNQEFSWYRAALEKKLCMFDLFTDIRLAPENSRCSCFLPLPEAWQKVAKSMYWDLAGRYIVHKSSNCFTGTSKRCKQKTIGLYVSKLVDIFDISQHSFAYVI